MARGWNQVTFARLLETTSANVNNWVKGRHKPPIHILERLANLTGVPTDYIYRGEMRWVPPDLLPAIVVALNEIDRPAIGQKRPYKRFRKRKD